MADSSQDEDEKMEYIKADLLQQQPTSSRPPSNRTFRAKGFGVEDDDSSNLFMSEPSISEADESSEMQMRLLSPFGSFTEDEDELHGRGYLAPPPPPARLLTPQAPSSPGNTSLSSWESPHVNQHRIHLHFSPGGDSLSHRADASVQSNPQTQNHYQRVSPHHSSFHPPQHLPHDPYLASGLIPPSTGAKTPDRSYVNSSNSTSPASEGQQRLLESFLEDLRTNSKGQVQEAVGANTSFESSTYAGAPNDKKGILRTQPNSSSRKQPQQHSRMSSIDTTAVDNTSSAGEGSDHGSDLKGTKVKNADETVVMVLSDDSGDETKKTTEGSERTPLDWEGKESADDEKTAGRRVFMAIRSSRSLGAGGGRGVNNNGSGKGHRRQRSGDAASGTLSSGSKSFGAGGGRGGNNGGGKGHRRQRSGDAAAATLSTGSKEWKGMELNKIPLPPVPGGHDDDEDDDDDVKNVKPMNGSNRSNKPRQVEGIKEATTQKNRSVTPSSSRPSPSQVKQEISQFSQFALGTGGNEEYFAQRRSSRIRYRRDSYRGRKTAGLMLDSEDSSSSMASWDPPLESQQGRRTASLPSSAFTGYLASPDWSTPGNHQHTRKVNPPVHWSPLSHHSGTTASAGMDEYNYGAVRPSGMTTLPTSRPHDPVARSSSLEFGTHARSQSLEAGNVGAWGNHSTGSLDTSFSWLSGNNNSFFPSSEMSPLIGSEFKTYGVQPQQSKSHPAIRPYEFETEVRAKNRRGVNFGPILSEGKKVFDSSPFSKIGKKFTKADRSRFLPSSHFDDNDENQPSFVCPVCKTRQREFFTVTNAPRQFESASGYIAFYFGIYVISALYIFGLQEGWGKLDCIYFAVITLTTAGLGDFVPTSDGAKVVCSIFIYFGVACIGLLLGSYIAGMLDESSRRAAQANRIKSCPNCVRIKNIQDAAERRRKLLRREKKLQQRSQLVSGTMEGGDPPGHDSKRMKRQHGRESFQGQIQNLTRSDRPNGGPSTERARDQFRKSNSADIRSSPTTLPESPLLSVETVLEDSPSSHSSVPSTQHSRHVPPLSSPSTARILRRQSHSRHASMDLGGAVGALNVPPRRKYSVDLGVPATIEETPGSQSGANNPPPPPPPHWQNNENGFEGEYDNEDDDSSSSSGSSSDSSFDEASLNLEEQYNPVENARYVFLTLREALINSLVIIGTGCFGFYFIEGFSFVDSWYFTTVLLTTVGYGDLVPYTKGGKLFATVYILVAGTILLNNMSMISMIPLELRRRRTEKAVLTQFGDSLDDSALRELATGPLIRRLNLATDHALDECTREMFCLAMLVRLGKVTEEDIKLTFAAFKKLDVNDENVLNSRAIIAGMIQKRRSTRSRESSQLDLANLAETPDDPPSNRSRESSYGFSPWGSGVTSNIFVPSSTPTHEVSSMGGTFDSTTSTPSTPHSELDPPHYWRNSSGT